MSTADHRRSTRPAPSRGTRWRLSLAAAAGATALAAGLLAWPGATPADAAVGAGTYTIKNAGSGLCLTVPNASAASGVQLQQASCGGGGQAWTLTSVSGGFKITSAAGLCLGVRDASTSAGKAIEQQSCAGTATQTWSPTAGGSNYRVVNNNGGKCMNTQDNSTSAGALVQQNSCDSVATKQWTFTPTSGGPTSTTTSTSTTSRTTTTTTTTGNPGGGDGSGPWPSDTGSVHQTTTRNVGTYFNGGMKKYYGIGDGGQGESQDPMFVVSNGGTIENVIIDAPAGDGIHCEGSCTIRNVWWNDVGEDAATFKSSSSSAQYLVDGGGAKSASDKVFQHNGAGTLTIRNFQVNGAGKLYRACGNCATSYQRHVVMDGVTARSTKALAGINTNWGDTARFSRITVYGSAVICEKYQGVPKGSEPKKIGEGADGRNCFYSPSDITWR
ncbi:ricin-type beta-trefoil lectin protein [Saccharothrix saharensis]|uniref:pectate lyase n=1 Tax=Saccharothrix saharensis TaxID=571190 RepID=A0A543J6E3_9PSEU|nr:pectate lyase [Saccharothrix saharensis]TQM78362.1 ricin-type beta-trefoil lectin protein [Saccharothrix saharensis]